MRKIAQRHSSKLAAALGLLALGFSTLPAQAEEQRVAAVPGIAMNALPPAAEVKTVKPAAKAAVKSSAKADAKDVYERDLWRHQGAG